MSAVSVSIVYQGLEVATQRLGEMVDALVDLGQELESRVAVINRFEGSLEGLAERTGGAVSELRAMEEHSTLAARGINLSARDLNNVFVRALETSAATGRDFNQVLEQLNDGLATGSTEALGRFNLSIDATGDRTRDVTAALGQLEEQVGDVSSRADTAGGSIDIMATAADNARTAFFEAFDATSSLTGGLGDIVVAVTGVDASFGDVMDGIARAATTAGAVVGGILEQMATAVRQTAEIFRALARGDLDAAGQHFLQQQATVRGAGLVDRIDERREAASSARDAREAEGSRTTVSPGGGGRRGGGGEREFTYEEGLQEALERQYASEEEIRERAATRERELEEESDRLKTQNDEMESARLDDLRQKAADSAQAEIDNIRRIAEERQEAFDKAKQASRQQQQANTSLGQEAAGVAKRIGMAYFDAFQQAIEGTASLEDAVLAATKNLLKSFGEELIAKGIGKILEGFAELPSPTAATKIGGGAAMVAFGVGLGAAGAAIPSPQSAGAEQPRQEQSRDGGGGGGDTTIVFGSPVLTAGTQAQLARGLARVTKGGRSFPATVGR